MSEIHVCFWNHLRNYLGNKIRKNTEILMEINRFFFLFLLFTMIVFLRFLRQRNESLQLNKMPLNLFFTFQLNFNFLKYNCISLLKKIREILMEERLKHPIIKIFSAKENILLLLPLIMFII